MSEYYNEKLIKYNEAFSDCRRLYGFKEHLALFRRVLDLEEELYNSVIKTEGLDFSCKKKMNDHIVVSIGNCQVLLAQLKYIENVLKQSSIQKDTAEPNTL